MSKWRFWKRDKEDNPDVEILGVDKNTIDDVLNIDHLGNNIYVGSPNAAMKLAAVYRCIDILSGSIASLPLRLKVKKNGVFQLSENNSINYLLSVQANRRLSAYDLIQNAVIQMVNCGNAYILPRYIAGDLDELILLSPNTTTYDINADKYHINDFINGIVGVYSSCEIIHLRNMSLNGGYTGVSTIQYASRVMGVAANADERTLDSFKPGSIIRGFISGDGTAGIKGFGSSQDEQLELVKGRIEKEINSGKNLFHVSGDMKFNPLSMSPTDLQLLETRKFSVLDICRFYGVHPDKVFAGQSQNYKASEMSSQSFLSDTLQPHLRKIESEFTAKLIPKSMALSMKIEFDVESLLMTSLEQQANYIEKTIHNGVYSLNYWRRIKGQAPVKGGDEVMMSMNVAPINSEKFRGVEENLPPKTDDNDNK